MSTTRPIPLPSPAFMANSRWIESHLDQLAHQYPDQWIAVDRGKVLAAGSDLDEVGNRAPRLSPSPKDIAFEFTAGVTVIF